MKRLIGHGSGIGQLSWDSKIWYGAGNLGKVSTVEETTELKATGASFQLSGIPADLITKVSTAKIQGHKARCIWALSMKISPR